MDSQFKRASKNHFNFSVSLMALSLVMICGFAALFTVDFAKLTPEALINGGFANLPIGVYRLKNAKTTSESIVISGHKDHLEIFLPGAFVRYDFASLGKVTPYFSITRRKSITSKSQLRNSEFMKRASMKTPLTGQGLGTCSKRVCRFAIYLNEKYGYMAFSYSFSNRREDMRITLFNIFNGSSLNTKTVLEMIEPNRLMMPDPKFVLEYYRSEALKYKSVSTNSPSEGRK